MGETYKRTEKLYNVHSFTVNKKRLGVCYLPRMRWMYPMAYSSAPRTASPALAMSIMAAVGLMSAAHRPAPANWAR